MEIDIDKLKEEWLDREFDEKKFKIKAEPAAEFAIACGEVDPRYTDPSHADFRAPTSFTAQFTGGRIFPEVLSPLVKKSYPFDAGKCVEAHGVIRADDILVGKSKIHDVYEKTGRSGPMLFLVHRMTFTNQSDELVSIVDWRMVIRNHRSL